MQTKIQVMHKVKESALIMVAVENEKVDNGTLSFVSVNRCLDLRAIFNQYSFPLILEGAIKALHCLNKLDSEWKIPRSCLFNEWLIGNKLQ
jgi:hypothetical protein